MNTLSHSTGDFYFIMFHLLLMASFLANVHCANEDNFMPINVSLNLTEVEAQFGQLLEGIHFRLDTLNNGSYYIPASPKLENVDPRSEWRAAIFAADALIQRKAIVRLTSLSTRLERCIYKYKSVKQTTILVKAKEEEGDLIQINDSWRVDPTDDQKLGTFVSSFFKGVAKYGQFVLDGEPLELTKTIFQDIVAGYEFDEGDFRKVDDEDRTLLLTSFNFIQEQINHLSDNVALICDISHDLNEEIINPNVQHLTNSIIGYEEMANIISQKNEDLYPKRLFVDVELDDLYKPGVVPIVRTYSKQMNVVTIHCLMPTSHIEEDNEEDKVYHWGASRQQYQFTSWLHSMLNSIPVEIMELCSPIITAIIAWILAKRSEKKNQLEVEQVIADRGLLLEELRAKAPTL